MMTGEESDEGPEPGGQNLIRVCNAIKEALLEMEKCPGDSVQDIWNEALGKWKTGFRMDHNKNIVRE